MRIKSNAMKWILLVVLIVCLNGCSGCSSSTPSYNSSSSYEESSGYMDEKEYTPTVNKDGEYHTIDGKKKQIQYQGSKEQKSDLDKIDQYMKDHPDF